MVIDKGLGRTEYKDLVDMAAEYIDYIKLGFGTCSLYPKELLAFKIEKAQEQNIMVYPGGTFFEYCYHHQNIHAYLKQLSSWGVEALEISDGTIDLPRSDRDDIIHEARAQGFQVITECGKKESGTQLEVGEIYETLVQDLECGAQQMIVEGRESGQNVGIYDEKGNTSESMLHLLGERLGDLHRALIWEAPQKKQQALFIQEFGANVNLGNIQPHDVYALECLRRGLRADTFQLINGTPGT